MPVPIKQLHTLPLGGAAAVKKQKVLPEPNIVKTYQLGNSTVHIADNAYRDMTPEEIEKVLDEYHAAGWRIIESLGEAELQEIEDGSLEGGESLGSDDLSK